MKKKLVCALLSAAMVSSMLTGCGGSTDEGASTETTETTETTDEATDDAEAGDEATDDAEGEDTASAEGGKVYYLNFKPEIGSDWEELAAKYTAETGVEVKVVTAASGTYEQTLKSESFSTRDL